MIISNIKIIIMTSNNNKQTDKNSNDQYYQKKKWILLASKIYHYVNWLSSKLIKSSVINYRSRDFAATRCFVQERAADKPEDLQEPFAELPPEKEQGRIRQVWSYSPQDFHWDSSEAKPAIFGWHLQCGERSKTTGLAGLQVVCASEPRGPWQLLSLNRII